MIVWMLPPWWQVAQRTETYRLHPSPLALALARNLLDPSTVPGISGRRQALAGGIREVERSETECAPRLAVWRSISPADITFGLVAAAAAVIFAVYSITLPPNHDIAWLLYVADRVLGGARLYVDVIETNPPLIVFLSLPAAALARLLPISAILAFKLEVLALIAVSLSLCARIFGSQPPGLSREMWRTMLIVILVVLLPGAGYNFGQREHLSLILVLPYLCSAVARVTGRTPPYAAAILTGIMAGLGIAMKPFFLPLWIATEGYLALRRGLKAWARTESIAILGVFLSYVVAICFLTPDYFTVVAWAAQTYGAFFSQPRRLLLLSPEVLVSMVVITATWFLRAGDEFVVVRSVITITLAAYLTSFVAQGKGWLYHSYPAIGTMVIMCMLTVLARIGSITRRLRQRLAPQTRALYIFQSCGRDLAHHRAAGLGLVLLLLGSLAARRTAADFGELEKAPVYLPQMRVAVERIAPGGSVSAITGNLEIVFPLVDVASLQWVSRFNCLWMLPGLYADQVNRVSAVRYHTMDQMSALEHYVIDAVIEDLQRYQPDVLIIDSTHNARLPRGFDYLEYFGRDPRFVAEFAAYSYSESVHRYRIYRRNGKRPAAAEPAA